MFETFWNHQPVIYKQHFDAMTTVPSKVSKQLGAHPVWSRETMRGKAELYKKKRTPSGKLT